MSLRSLSDAWFRRLMYGALIWLLAWEWLRPLPEMSDTLRIDVFLWAFGFFLLMDLLRIPWWARRGLKVCAILFFIHQLYATGPIFSKDWLYAIWSILWHDLGLAMEQSFAQIGPVSETFAFFLLLWMMEALVYFIVVIKGRALPVILVTVVQLSSFEVWLGYPAQWSIIRTMIIGFMLLSLLNFSMIEKRWRKATAKGNWPIAWIASTLAIVLVTVTAGYFTPKSEASWPDPVSWIQNSYAMGPGAGGGMLQKVGYGQSDTVLGGPFIQDETSVFIAETKSNTYWRGESKAIYTGSGWKTGNEIVREAVPSKAFPAALTTSEVYTETQVQKVLFESPIYPIFFAGGAISTIPKIIVSDRDTQDNQPPTVHYNEDYTKVRLAPGEGTLKYYEAKTVIPFWDKDQLKTSSTDYPKAIKEKYLQLPEKLPQRVVDKSIEVTKLKDNPYDQAKAIESYLRTAFPYQIEDASAPPKGRDFVDYFLFDLQQGYCDYFSTSMVVMLRANGIPARWVKGFAPGEVQKSETKQDVADTDAPKKDSPKTVVVRNLNAHSWVEVYFQDYGWVPFEPTPSFSAHWEEKKDETDSEVSSSQSTPSTPISFEERASQLLKMDQGSTGSSSSSSSFAWLFWLAALIALTVISLIIWFYRHPIWFWNLSRRCKSHGMKQGTEMVVGMLLKVFAIFGMHSPDMTVREYLHKAPLATKEQKEGLKELAIAFEQARYGDSESSLADRAYLRNLWKKITGK
jgi:transglutaminase-like putative cysteine protease